MMEKFEVYILGCGSALPTTRHFPTSQVLNIREKLFMIDCGEGAQLQLRRAKLSFNRLHHIFISHLHGDHCFGLMGLISTFDMLGRRTTLHLYAPKELKDLLAPQLHFHCPQLGYKVEFHAFDPNCSAVIYEDRSLTVTTIPLRHRVPCAGFLFAEPPSLNHINRAMTDFYGIPVYDLPRIKAGADYLTPEGELVPNHRLTTPAAPPRRYAYCSDTAFMPENASLLQGVDLLFHEATFTTEFADRAHETCHSTAEEAARMAMLAGAKRLMVGHFSARYNDESIILDEAKRIFPETLLAKESLCVKL